MSASHGQPNIDFSHDALRKKCDIGSAMLSAPDEVKKMCQPPLSAGSFLVRRATSVCQSIDCMSTLKPAASSIGLATGAQLVWVGRAGWVNSTIGVPS